MNENRHPERRPRQNPLPVTRRVITFLVSLTEGRSIGKWLHRTLDQGPSSSFLECYAVARLGFLTSVLFGGFLILYDLRNTEWTKYLLVALFSIIALWSLLDNCARRIRTQLVDRQVGGPIYDAAGSIFLAFFAIVEAVTAFAVLYQAGFFLYSESPLSGEVLRHDTNNHVMLFPLDALYFSFVTMSTLGYGDIHPVSRWFRFLVMAELLTGIILVGLLLALAASHLKQRRIMLTKGPQQDRRQRRKRKRYLESLRNQEKLQDPQRAAGLRRQVRWMTAWLVTAVCLITLELILEVFVWRIQ